MQVRINSVTIVRKKFSEVHGVVQLISSVFGYNVSYVQVMYSRWKMQTGEAFF